MWVLTRNDTEVLKADGEWSYSHWGDPDEWRLFDCWENAQECAEQLGFGDFTEPTNLDAIFRKRHEVEFGMQRRQKKRLKTCEYVSLPEPLEFHSISEGDVPFDRFVVTHYIVSTGMVCGVLGYGNDDNAIGPFWSFVNDEYDYAFCEVYRRTETELRSSNLKDAS